jgi:hypothetical protein
VTAAEIIIARWDDWVLLEDAVCEVIARVGRKHALGLALINQSLHNEQLELALLPPDGSTLTVFSKEDCKRRTVHAPLNPREGTRIEPFEAGQPYVRGVVKLTSPATATPPADQQLSGDPAEAGRAFPAPAPASVPVANTESSVAEPEATSVAAMTTEPTQQILRMSRKEQSHWLKTTLADNPPGKDEPLTPEGYGKRIAEMGAPLGAMYEPSTVIARYYQLNPGAPPRRKPRK